MTHTQNRLIGLVCVILLVLAQTGLVVPQGGGDPTVSCSYANAQLAYEEPEGEGELPLVAGELSVDCTISEVPNNWRWNLELELKAPSGKITKGANRIIITTTNWAHFLGVGDRHASGLLKYAQVSGQQRICC